MGGTVDTCLKNTLVLNRKSMVFLSPKQLSDFVEGTGGFIMTIPCEILLLL